MYELWCDCGTKWPPETNKKKRTFGILILKEIMANIELEFK